MTFRFFSTINSVLYVSKYKSVSNSDSKSLSFFDTPVSLFDEYGSIPQLEGACLAISKCSSVAVVTGVNFTLVAYKLSDGSDPTFSSHQISPDSKPLHVLINPFQHILLTGIVGECKKVSIFAKEVVLNHTIEYGVPPTGLFIANKVGKYLQTFLSGETRPLACHCFILSSVEKDHFSKYSNNNMSELSSDKCQQYILDRNNMIIFEVLPDGLVTQVYAGIAGGNIDSSYLNDEYRRNCTSDEAKSLIDKLFHMNSNESINIRYHLFS